MNGVKKLGLLALPFLAACETMQAGQDEREPSERSEFEIVVNGGYVQVPEDVLIRCDHHVNITQNGFECASLEDMQSGYFSTKDADESVKFDAETIFSPE